MSIMERMRRGKQGLPPKVEQPDERRVPGDVMSRMIRARAENELSPDTFREVHRIVSLPVVHGYSQFERDSFERLNILGEAYEEGFRLHPEQIDAVLTFRDHGALLAPIGVGHGKTLITMMIAAGAYRDGEKRSVLLIPPQIYHQFMRVDLAWARKRVSLFGCPFIGVDGGAKSRKVVAKSGRRGCYVLPYSKLSTRDAEDLLFAIAPSVVIADECQNIRHPSTARTKRLMKFVNAEKPKCAFLSGTITNKSVMDYLHMARQLGDNSPLPIAGGVAREWAAALDSGVDASEAKTGPVYPLIEWARAVFPEEARAFTQTTSGFRRAYAKRLRSSPCVVVTGDREVGTSLIIRFVSSGSGSSEEDKETLDNHMRRVSDEWLTPTGDEIDFGMHKWKWLHELSSGIYNELYWPPADALMAKTGWDKSTAEELLDIAREHHELKEDYVRALRPWLLDHSRKNLDTAMLVGASFARNGHAEVGDEELYNLWYRAHEVKRAYPQIPERWSRVVRVCDYKVRRAAQWAEEAKTGIIWYHHQGVGRWLRDLIPDAIYAPAGANKEISESHNRIVIASLRAHGTGKNLQFHQNNFYLQVPRQAELMEQSLGRTHRFGQEADEMVMDMAIQQSAPKDPPTFDEMLYAAMLNDTTYVSQSTQEPRKAGYASYITMPKVFPSSWLSERGLDPRVLDKYAQRALLEKFGG